MNCMKKIIAKCLVFALVCSMWYELPIQKVNASSLTTFAKLDYGFSSTAMDIEASSDSKDYTLNKQKYGSKSAGYRFNTGSGTLYASIDGSSKRKLEWTSDTYSCSVNGKGEREPAMTAGKKNPWVSGSKPYFEIDVSTSGYTDVNFSAYVGASKKGPKYYRLSYAVGASNSFTVLSGSEISLSDNKLMTKISGKLPSAADNQSLVKVRVEVYSLKPVDSKLNSLLDNTTSGEACINHIILQGEKKSVVSNSTSTSSSNSTSNTSSKLKVKGISCIKKVQTLRKGQKKTLSLSMSISPKTAANVKKVRNKLTYKSSNKKVVSISKKGVIKAKKKGHVKVTVTYSKKIKTSCKITVK